MTDYFFQVIKEMFKSLSLSHQPPFTPCHTEKTARPPPTHSTSHTHTHTHTHTQKRVECDQMPDNFFIFSFP